MLLAAFCFLFPLFYDKSSACFEQLFANPEKEYPGRLPWEPFQSDSRLSTSSYYHDEKNTVGKPVETGADMCLNFFYSVKVLKMKLLNDIFQLKRNLSTIMEAVYIPGILSLYLDGNPTYILFGAAQPMPKKDFYKLLSEIRDKNTLEVCFRSIAEMISFVPVDTLGPDGDEHLQNMLNVGFNGASGITKLLRDALQGCDKSNAALVQRMVDNSPLKRFLLQFREFKSLIWFAEKDWRSTADDFLEGKTDQIFLCHDETFNYLTEEKPKEFASKCSLLYYAQVVSLVDVKGQSSGSLEHFETLKRIGCWDALNVLVRNALEKHFGLESILKEAIVTPPYSPSLAEGWNNLLPGISKFNGNTLLHTISYDTRWFNDLLTNVVIKGALRNPKLTTHHLIRAKQLIISLPRVDPLQLSYSAVDLYFQLCKKVYDECHVLGAVFMDFSVLGSRAPRESIYMPDDVPWWDNVLNELDVPLQLKIELIGTMRLSDRPPSVIQDLLNKVIQVTRSSKPIRVPSVELIDELCRCSTKSTSRECQAALQGIFKDNLDYLQVLRGIFFDTGLFRLNFLSSEVVQDFHHSFLVPTNFRHFKFAVDSSSEYRLLSDAISFFKSVGRDDKVFPVDPRIRKSCKAYVAEVLFRAVTNQNLNNLFKVARMISDPISGDRVLTMGFPIDPVHGRLLGNMYGYCISHHYYPPQSLSPDLLEAILDSENANLANVVYEKYYDNGSRDAFEFHNDVFAIEIVDLSWPEIRSSPSLLSKFTLYMKEKMFRWIDEFRNSLSHFIYLNMTFMDLSDRTWLQAFSHQSAFPTFEDAGCSHNFAVHGGNHRISCRILLESFTGSLNEEEKIRFLKTVNGHSLKYALPTSVVAVPLKGEGQIWRLGKDYFGTSNFFTGITDEWTKVDDIRPLGFITKTIPGIKGFIDELQSATVIHDESRYFISPKRYIEIFSSTFKIMGQRLDIDEFLNIFDPNHLLLYPGPFPLFVSNLDTQSFMLPDLDITVLVGYLIAHMAISSFQIL